MEFPETSSAGMVKGAETIDLLRFLDALKKDLEGRWIGGIGIMSIGIGFSISSGLETGWWGDSEPFLCGSRKPESLGLFFLIKEGL
jgi:hypothetical protein